MNRLFSLLICLLITFSANAQCENICGCQYKIGTQWSTIYVVHVNWKTGKQLNSERHISSYNPNAIYGLFKCDITGMEKKPTHEIIVVIDNMGTCEKESVCDCPPPTGDSATGKDQSGAFWRICFKVTECK